MEIYLVRHGKTKENEHRFYYGKTDTGILPESRVELESCSEWFLEQQFDRIYVSPLPRALQTAQILLPGKKIEADERLEERNFGIFETLTYEEILEKYPDQARCWEQEWMTYRIPEGESFLQVQERVDSFAKQIKRSKDQKILIVSHKGTMIQLMMALLEIPVDQYWKFTIKANCYSKIDYAYGNAVLTVLNQKLRGK